MQHMWRGGGGGGGETEQKLERCLQIVCCVLGSSADMNNKYKVKRFIETENDPLEDVIVIGATAELIEE